MKSIIFIFVTLVVYTTASFSAIGQEWVARYNGAGNTADWGYAVVTDADGNVYVTGYSTGSGTGKDYRTIKYSPSGSVVWTATFNGPVNGGDYAYAIALDAAENVYVTGRVDYGTPLSDIVTIKYNSNGVQQWAARYTGAANGVDEGKCIHVDPLGNVYVGGKTFTVTDSYNFITIKYDAAGVEQWNATYNGPGNNEDLVYSLAVDNSGNVIVGGSSIGLNTGSDFAVVKYNSDGTLGWVKRHNGEANGGDAVVSVKADASGNIYAAGYSDRGGSLKYDIMLAKYDAAGTQQYISYYNGAGVADNFATAMVIDEAANVYITGASISASSVRDSNYVTLKYNSAGTLLWYANYSGPNGSVDVSRSIFVDANHNVYITGTSSEVNSHDYVSVKYNPNGATEWIMSYNGPSGADDYSTSITADNEGNAYVTGRSIGSGTDFDYATIKYGDLVGVNQISTNIPNKFNLYQNYPNPFNPSTKIKFDLPENANVTLKVYNSAGMVVLNELLGDLSAASYEYNFNAANISSGIYFYEVNAGNFRNTKKMVLIK